MVAVPEIPLSRPLAQGLRSQCDVRKHRALLLGGSVISLPECTPLSFCSLDASNSVFQAQRDTRRKKPGPPKGCLEESHLVYLHPPCFYMRGKKCITCSLRPWYLGVCYTASLTITNISELEYRPLHLQSWNVNRKRNERETGQNKQELLKDTKGGVVVTPRTVTRQAPRSTRFPWESWSRLPFPSPRDLPDSGIEPASPALAGKFFTTEPAGKPIESVGYS